MSDIHAAMIAVMREVGAISKDRKNQQQGFMFRGIDQCYNALHALMAKHGVFSTSEVLNVERSEKTSNNNRVLLYSMVTMRYRFYAADGSSVTTEVVGEGMDSGDKATNKAMAIAHKYALLQALMVPTEQVDPDAESHEVTAPVINEAQGNELAELMTETGADYAKFVSHFGVKSLEELPASQFQRALAALKKKQQAKAAA